MKHNRVSIYDTEEVLEWELTKIEKKCGEDYLHMLDEYVVKEVESIKKDILEDKDIEERVEHTIEDEGGDIWVCLKLFNVSRLQQMFGTEPE